MDSERHGFHCDDDESVKTLHELVQEAIAADRANHSTPARLRHCPTHGQQPPEAWGCPECVRELREELAAARLQQAPEPVDLDALLSPGGPWESYPGCGNAVGAQLVCDQHGGNPKWWAPVLGCDSLGDLLSRIRSRILPHLRPPILGIDVPGPDGDYGDIVDLCEAEGVGVAAGARLLRRARAAWGQATTSQRADHIPGPAKMVSPPAEGEVGEMVAELRHFLAGYQQMRGLDPEYIYSIHRGDAMEAHLRVSRLTRAAALIEQQAEELAVLGQQATPPAEGEVGDLVVWLRSLIGESVCFESGSENASKLVRAAYLLLTQPHQIAELQRQLNRRTHLNG